MFRLFILASIGILCCVNGTSTNSNNSMDTKMQIIRNQYLRMCVWKKAKIATSSYQAANLKRQLAETKEKIKDRTNKIYNTVLLKYYDSQAAYYSLPSETREVIEQLINLHF
jgi:hypothetical protein